VGPIGQWFREVGELGGPAIGTRAGRMMGRRGAIRAKGDSWAGEGQMGRGEKLKERKVG
jgi:hypothetical protein